MASEFASMPMVGPYCIGSLSIDVFNQRRRDRSTVLRPAQSPTKGARGITRAW
jgi:hypothetical protein